MAYIRGEYYLWRDESRLHIWVADGYDEWNLSAWAMNEQGKRRSEMSDASGVSIPLEIIDEFIVMRLAEMLEEGLVEQAIDRAISNWGRPAFNKAAPKLKSMFDTYRNDESDALN